MKLKVMLMCVCAMFFVQINHGFAMAPSPYFISGEVDDDFKFEPKKAKGPLVKLIEALPDEAFVFEYLDHSTIDEDGALKFAAELASDKKLEGLFRNFVYITRNEAVLAAIDELKKKYSLLEFAVLLRVVEYKPEEERETSPGEVRVERPPQNRQGHLVFRVTKGDQTFLAAPKSKIGYHTGDRNKALGFYRNERTMLDFLDGMDAYLKKVIGD